MAPATILIVDDDRPFSRVVVRHLKRTGYHAVSLSSGQEALEWLSEHHADLLLLDFRLEDMTADELVSALKKRERQTEFIVITAFGDERLAVDMMKQGARDYLMKGASLFELLPVVVAQALERARQERRLAETEASLRQLELAVSHARDGVAILTAGETPKVVYTNPAFRRLTGHTAAELADGGLALLHGEEGPLDELHARFAAGESFRGRLPLTTDRREVLLDTQLTPIRDADDVLTHFIAVQRDITRQALLEERMQNAHKMEAIGQLAGGVAHDFNNILTVILGHIGLMRHNPEMPRRFRDALDLIEEATLHGSQLTAQLLSFSRKQVLSPTIVDLNTLVENTDRMLSRVLGDGLIFQAKIAPEPMYVLADAGEIQRALINLAVNARDAMPDGGTLTISTARAQRPGEHSDTPYVCLVIEDTGVGMSEAIQARIFEPFYTTKETGKGTGLGLSTVYGIVQQSRGLIQVESTIGEGTRFIIYIPQATPDSTPVPTTETAGTILIAEDDDMVRQLVRLSLEEAGYQVLEASSGSAALEVLSRIEPPDLLITDVMMPGMTGTELAQRARDTYPGLRILLISGYTGIQHNDLAFELLPKPFTTSALQERVRVVLGSTR